MKKPSIKQLLFELSGLLHSKDRRMLVEAGDYIWSSWPFQWRILQPLKTFRFPNTSWGLYSHLESALLLNTAPSHPPGDLYISIFYLWYCQDQFCLDCNHVGKATLLALKSISKIPSRQEIALKSYFIELSNRITKHLEAKYFLELSAIILSNSDDLQDKTSLVIESPSLPNWFDEMDEDMKTQWLVFLKPYLASSFSGPLANHIFASTREEIGNLNL